MFVSRCLPGVFAISCDILGLDRSRLGSAPTFLYILFLLSYGTHAFCLVNTIFNNRFELFPDLHGAYVPKAFVE